MLFEVFRRLVVGNFFEDPHCLVKKVTIGTISPWKRAQTLVDQAPWRGI